MKSITNRLYALKNPYYVGIDIGSISINTVVLDKEKKVFDAYSPLVPTTASTMVGSSYAGIAFEGKEESSHTVLVLYRPDKGHPMGSKGIELAIPIRMGEEMLGWIVFQMDMDFLNKRAEIDEEAMKQFRFEDS